MLATQVAYSEADGTPLLDKGVTPCAAGDLAAARADRDAGLTHLQCAKLRAEDDVWDAWPRPVPEELLRAADAARKAAAAEARAFAAVMEATAPAMKAAAGAAKAANGATKAAAAAVRKAAAAARKADAAAAKKAAAAATKAAAAARKAGAAARKARAPKRSVDWLWNQQGAPESVVAAGVVARRRGAQPSFALGPAEEAPAAATTMAAAVAEKAASSARRAAVVYAAAAKRAAAVAKRARPERMVKWKLSGCTVAVTPLPI